MAAAGEKQMDNSLLAVRGSIHKYIAADRKRGSVKVCVDSITGQGIKRYGK